MSRHPNTIACALARVVLALVTLAFAVHADEPTAAFETSVTSGLAPLEVTFTDLSTGEVESWSWSFGDGTVSTEPSPTHVFEEPGSFTVKLTVTGPDGSDSVEVEDLIVVTAPPPVANFTTENAHGTAPLTVAFTDASDGWIDTWSWDFGDGETSTEQSPVHVYANPGQYTIRLTVTGPGGTNTRVRAGVVRALVPAPIAEPFATPTAGRAPLVVQFEDRLVGEATSWSWDFGDGAGSQSPAPTHTYDRGGSYTVTLAVTGPGGVHEVVLEETIVVQAMAPVAQVRVPKSEGRAPLAVQFNDESEGEIERWSWEFGDGETSNQSSPEHVYSEPGDYVWTLEVEDAQLPPDAIGYVSAHGTATDRGDIAESQATARLFGDSVPISAFKSFTGHTLGASGALEAWVAIEMMNSNWFHATVNLDHIDPACGDLDYITGSARSIETEYVMSNNFAFGGINTSMIFRRWDRP